MLRFYQHDFGAFWFPDLFRTLTPKRDDRQTERRGKVGDPGVMPYKCRAGREARGQIYQRQILSKFDTFRRQFASQALSSPLLCFTTDKKEIEIGIGEQL